MILLTVVHVVVFLVVVVLVAFVLAELSEEGL
jgi:hypothetical protein